MPNPNDRMSWEDYSKIYKVDRGFFAKMFKANPTPELKDLFKEHEEYQVVPITYGGKTVAEWERILNHHAKGDPVKDLGVHEDHMLHAIADFISFHCIVWRTNE